MWELFEECVNYLIYDPTGWIIIDDIHCGVWGWLLGGATESCYRSHKQRSRAINVEKIKPTPFVWFWLWLNVQIIFTYIYIQFFTVCLCLLSYYLVLNRSNGLSVSRTERESTQSQCAGTNFVTHLFIVFARRLATESLAEWEENGTRWFMAFLISFSGH